MREIKFRVWLKGLNNMCDVKSINFDSGTVVVRHEEHHNHFDKNRSEVYDIVGNHAVDVMQYTGLKDKNGKEIYEGDIVILDNNWDSFSFNAGEKMEVCFNDGSFVIRHKEFKNKYYTISDSLNEIEVIGNIHENKELLEK